MADVAEAPSNTMYENYPFVSCGAFYAEVDFVHFYYKTVGRSISFECSA